MKLPSLSFIFCSLLLSTYVFSNCPTNIQSHLSAKSTQHLWQVIDSLTNCPQKADSLGMLYRKLSIRYYLKENLDSAVFLAQKAIDLWENIGYRDSLEIGLAHDNLGIYQQEQNPEFAKNAFFSAIAIFKKLAQAEALARVYWRLGDLFYNEFSEYHQAERYYEEGLVWAKKAKKRSAMLQRKNLIGLSNIYLAFNESQKSLATSDAVLQLLGNTGNKDLQVVFSNQGMAYKQLEQWDNAEHCYRKALDFSLRNNISRNLSTIYANLSNTLRKKGNFKEALKLCEERQKIAQEDNDLEALAQIYDNKGEVYFDQKNYEEALRYFHQSVATLIPKYGGVFDNGMILKRDLAAVQNISDLLTYLPDKARALKKIYEEKGDIHFLEEAQNCFLLTDKFIDFIRFQHNDTDSKFFWRKQVKPIYEKALEVAFLLQDAAQGYHFFEKSKSILLLDAFNEAKAHQEIPPDIQQKEYELKAALLEAQKINDTETELMIDHEMRMFLTALAQDYPKYHEVRYQVNILPFANAKLQVKHENHLHIHWFMGDTAVYFLAFNQEESYFEQLPNSPQIKRQLQDFCQWFEKSYLIENNPEKYCKEAHQLFKTLFPTESFASQQYTSITFFADDLLNFMPFEALIVQPLEEKIMKFSAASWWVKTTNINYAYSATVLKKQAENTVINENASKEVIGFAPFFATASNGLFELKSEDLLWLQNHISGQYFFGNQASVADFKSMNSQNGLLHLSTHATTGNDTKDCQIYFFQDSLMLADLYLQSMNVDLVVLSACETGIGEVAEGEGLLSLSRGFTHAGVASLIAGLWKINDHSTSQILIDFYKILNTGATKSEALYQAKMNLVNGANPQMTSPYYWSSLVYSGADGRMTLQEKSFFAKYWKFGSIILVIGLVVLLVLRNK